MYKYLFLLTVSFFLTSCVQYKEKNMKHDLQINQSNQAMIKGIIKTNKKSTKDIYIILYKYIKGDIQNIENYKLVDFSMNSIKNNQYKFNVTQGKYKMYAYQNLEKLKDKKYAYTYISNIIHVPKNSTVSIDVKLSPKATITTDDNILIASNQENSIFQKIAKIKITTLKNNKFDRDNANLGLWNPLKFFKQVGVSLDLLEKYDKDKKIILFIHGIKGTPRDFEGIINSLDNNKYLPIVYYYPTGINLNYSVNILEYYMSKLQKQYGVKEIIIIAHSMGGLVARAFINQYKNINIKKFITLVTPWNGQKYAQLGGDFAKKIAPSFGNMVPKSSFLENNQNIEFPKNLKHYLLFAYKAKQSFILDNSNDGVISLSSQLYDKAQKKAYDVYGFNESHADILKAPKAILYINDILNTQ